MATYLLASDLSVNARRVVVVGGLAFLQGIIVGLAQAVMLGPSRAGRRWFSWPLTSGIAWAFAATVVAVVWTKLPGSLASATQAHFVARCACTGLVTAGGLTFMAPHRRRQDKIVLCVWNTLAWASGAGIGTAVAVWFVSGTLRPYYPISSLEVFLLLRWGLLGVCAGAALLPLARFGKNARCVTAPSRRSPS